MLHALFKDKTIFIRVLFLILFVELISFDVKPVEDFVGLEHISYQIMESMTVDDLTEGWIEMSQTSIKKPEKGISYYALKLEHPISQAETLFIPQVLSNEFCVYDKDFQLIYQWKAPKFMDNYSYFVNMAFIPIFSGETYIIAKTIPEFIHMGVDYETGVLPLNQLTTSFDSRKSIALILILMSLILFIMNDFLGKKNTKEYLIHTGLFAGVFGLWAIFDLYRHSYWIRMTFTSVPLPIILFIYIMTSNLMAPLFIKLNKTLLKESKYITWINALQVLIWIIAWIGITFEILRIFYWNETAHTLYQMYFMVYEYTVSIGSLLMIVLAWADIKKRGFKGVIYAVGLTGCLISFTVSQMTPFLVSHWGVLWLFISIIWVMTITFGETIDKNESYLLELKEMNTSMALLNEDLKYTQKELLLRLGSTVDLKSKETSQHVNRVAAITEYIAYKMNFDEQEIQRISLASTLHDIGKVGIPDEILNAPGKLTEDQYEQMKAHSVMGYEILNGSDNLLMDYSAIIALAHHERYDGKGYPNRLKGDEIPIIAAIVAAADVMDALLSKRVYKPAWTFGEVYDYFVEQRGGHFHPQIADVVIQNYDDIKILSKKF